VSIARKPISPNPDTQPEGPGLDEEEGGAPGNSKLGPNLLR